MLASGATIGILGGGQLGRMTALAAYRLGYRCHIFAGDPDSPGAQVATEVTVGDLGDQAALAQFAARVDVVTYETENIPVEALSHIAALAPVHPGLEVLRITQDRLREKDWLRSVEVPTTAYREITGPPALARALKDLPGRAILKTVRMGYDGKGQVPVVQGSDPEAVWAELMGSSAAAAQGALPGSLAAQAILEAHVDFRCEVSVIVARGANGAMANYPAVENQHANHILETTIAPARIPEDAAMRAEAVARHVAERLGVVGLIAVEMFLTEAGEILVNELAPRPHNSGHWTIDACYTSQFEQLVRALAGLPLGSTEHHSDAVMRNLIGAEVEHWRDWLNDPAVKLHLYGKTAAPPGRKMGHATRLMPRR